MSRSRSGCLTCKRRHRKCDETRPDCLQCVGQGIECEGYDVVLRWGTGIASRGRFTGAPAPVETPPAKRRRLSSSPRSSSHATDDSGTSHEKSSSLANRSGGLSTPSPASIGVSSAPVVRAVVQSPQFSESPLTESQWPGRTDQDRTLYQSFNNSTVYLLYSTRRDDQFRQHLRRLADGSEALSSILIATHLYVSSPANPPSLFEEYYVRGLHLFRKQLESYKGSVNVGVMCAGLFICTLNLFQSAPWSVHLELMTTVYGLSGSLHGSALLANPEVSFPLELMAVMDMPTFVRGRATTTLGLWRRLREARRSYRGSRSPGEGEGGIENVTSLPRSLLDIFAIIQDESAESAFLAWPGELGEVPQIHLWEAYRFAGILTCRRIKGSRAPSSDSPAPMSPSAPSTELLLGRLVAAIDALCDTRKRSEYEQLLTANSLLYPYVAARLEVLTLRRRPAWMEALCRAADVCQPYGCTANARNIAGMLEEAWETGNDGYDIDSQAKKRNVELALF